MPSDEVEGKVGMNNVARNKLRVKLSDFVHVQQLQNIEYGKRIHVLPFDERVLAAIFSTSTSSRSPWKHTGQSERATRSSFVAACDPWSSRSSRPIPQYCIVAQGTVIQTGMRLSAHCSLVRHLKGFHRGRTRKQTSATLATRYWWIP